VVAAQAPVDAVNSVGAALRAQIATCDAKIARYKAPLDAGADPAVVAGWITTSQASGLRRWRSCGRLGIVSRGG